MGGGGVGGLTGKIQQTDMGQILDDVGAWHNLRTDFTPNTIVAGENYSLRRKASCNALLQPR
jgi:hypothetical protein